MRIATITITAFRGVPGTLTVDLRPWPSDDPVSLLLTGDNGTGKSSIVDALEFGLQGHFAQSRHLATTRLPSLVSFAATDAPSVSITLSDGTIITRQTVQDEQGLLSSVTQPHPSFQISPFVLRRADILRFLDSTDSERTLVFGNYLRSPGQREWHPPPREQLADLRDQRLNAKVERDRVASALATALKVDISEIPVVRNEFRVFIHNRLYGGVSKEAFEKRGIRLKVNTRAEELAGAWLVASENHSELKARIKAFAVEPDGKGFPTHLIPEMNAFLKGVEARLTSAFRSVSTASFVTDVAIEFGTIGDLALRIGLVLTNGKTASPRQVLSEANLDLLALLFFVALAQESVSRGQAPFLILDDVLQSVDSTVRVAFVDYVLSELKDWQLIFTVHDRLWQEQLVHLFRRRAHRFRALDILTWSFESGPAIADARLDREAGLTDALKSGRTGSICSETGLLLERLSHELSVALPISVVRKSGDRYTLGDLWPGILKALRKTTAASLAEAVDRWLHLRNLLGAHYNDWAQSVALSEAQQFGTAAIALNRALSCDGCSTVVSLDTVSRDSWHCRCGALVVAKRPSDV